MFVPIPTANEGVRQERYAQTIVVWLSFLKDVGLNVRLVSLGLVYKETKKRNWTKTKPVWNQLNLRRD